MTYANLIELVSRVNRRIKNESAFDNVDYYTIGANHYAEGRPYECFLSQTDHILTKPSPDPKAYLYRAFSLYSLYTNGSLLSCGSGQKETVDFIKSLGLLSDDEQILKYYSNFEKDKAGNFFTTKRIAHYWLDDYDKAKNDTSFAFYHEIVSIDTLYEAPDTFAPYMTITKKDSSKFKVYIGENKSEMKSFFEDAIITWRKSRN